ncbi:hypothetical protein ACOMHN_021566 [Nucella lapillus]
MLCWKFFGVLLWTALLRESGAAWLMGKKGPAPGRAPIGRGSQGSCQASGQATCWCGEGTLRRQTVLSIKQCEYYTSWGPECEPCMSEEELCRTIEGCARCPHHNPDAICSECPPDKWGVRCEHERPCKAPNVTEHMTIHPYFTKKDVYKMEFRCTGGRVRVGPKTIRCQQNNQWNKTPPKCVRPVLCASLPSSPLPSTRVKEGSYVSSERVVYECDAGYVNSGPVLETVLQCDNGAWVQIGDSVQCEPIPQCSRPPVRWGVRLTHDTPIRSAYHGGEVVQYECEDGFSPLGNYSRGNFTLTCFNKQWLGPIPLCELIGCKRLNLDHGELTYSGDANDSQSDYLPLNTTAVATCHKAYTLQDPQPAACSSSGRWEPSPPRCVPKACEDMVRGKMCSVKPTGINVTLESNETEIYPGQIVKFKCSENNYRKKNVGQAERVCIHNGTLSSGCNIECVYTPACRVVLPPDQHIRYCKGLHCIRHGRDSFLEKTYDWPSDVVPVFSHFEFFCDNHHHYCVNGSHQFLCLNHKDTVTFQAPKCIPVCGVRRYPVRPLIMGGRASMIAEWPWQAALLEVHRGEVEFSCGATLVDDRWAITAAHCVTFDKSSQVKDPSRFRLTYGLSSSTDARLHARDKRHKGKYKVAEIIVNQGYNNKSLDNDIALLRLETPATLNHHVGIACLPTGDKQLQGGEEGVVTGWGQTESEGLPPQLQELSLTVVNTSQCTKYFTDQENYKMTITEGMFCAISNSSLRDTTSGDSGGPFVVAGKC